jgi:hypothetical protein
MRARLKSFTIVASSVVATSLVSFQSVLGQQVSAQELWKLVARSHVIVDGAPDVPLAEIDKANHSGKHEYINIAVRVAKCLKGDDCPETIVVRYFTRPASYSPSARSLAELNRQKSILFLSKVDEASVRGFYFTQTSTAIQPFSHEFIDRLSTEISAQKEIIDQFGRYFRPESEPGYAKVRALIETMVSRRTEETSFTELEAMGQSAVPAMIMLMDDGRRLPVPHISLRNKAPAFETFRQYGPEVVTDAITAILNQITGEDFGVTMNGGSERERKAAVDGWRVYLYRTRFGQQDLTSRCSRPLAAPMRTFEMTATLQPQIKLALASGG